MEHKKENEAEMQADVEEDEPIHLPPPSWAPIILALGLACALFGVVLSAVLLVLGVLVTVIGLGMWIYDEIRNASSAEPHNEHTTHTA